MPYVNVHIDIDDVIDEMSTEELQAEIDKRSKKKVQATGQDFSMSDREIRMTLDHAALKLRSLGEIALANRLDEIRSY